MYEIPRHSCEYLTELSEFMKVADEDRVKKHKKNQHLIVNGFVDEYICWSWQGELLVDNHNVRYEGNVDGTNANTDSRDDGYHDNLEDMLHDLEHNIDENDFDKLQQSFTDSEKPLYAGCTKFTKLSAILRLVKLKANNNWSDKSFTSLLELLHDMLPEDNELPVSYYQAKKVMCLMGLEVQRIHACPNDCILYRNEYKDLHECPVCGVSSAKDAKLLRWHAEERKKDGKLRHVADSSQWRNIDNVYTEFGQEVRNIRLGLSSDGINPFRNMSSRHSTWPVLLCVYNHPPWLCMKRKYIMMSLLIQGPKQPGNDIDVYLAPLIDDLQTLWNPGVAVYDAYKKETFNLRSMIFCTISDFPAYGNLSGYSTKGAKACPLCEDDTSSIWLKKVGKWCLWDIENHLKDIIHIVERKTCLMVPLRMEEHDHHWMEKRHFPGLKILIGLLLNIQGKTKDGVNVRYDMAEMNIRKELHPVEIEGKRW
ncbi:uncharacterized protein [Rutidosis leptorrhynchoides]|uniref:uncharacterized protein n=1 Tax=Rutidosis leptorrhynchoides TaxID=125765 RepID=UPI003A990159